MVFRFSLSLWVFTCWYIPWRFFSSEMNFWDSSFLYSATLSGNTSNYLVTPLNWSKIINGWAVSKASNNCIIWVVSLGLSAKNLGSSLTYTPFRWRWMGHSRWFSEPSMQIAWFIIMINYCPLCGSQYPTAASTVLVILWPSFGL